MSDGEEIVTERTGGGARAPQARCFRRIDTETAGVSQWHAISAAEFQQEEPDKSALENCAEKVVKVPSFAEAVSEEAVSESPAHSPSPPMKLNCPGSALGHESSALTAVFSISF
jgi:hypothetical protein